MSKHELSLEPSDFHYKKTLRLFDTSNYCDEDPIENYLVEVLPVNKSIWIPFYVQKGFSLTLNSSNLRYRKVSDESGLIELPDGIYEIKQSYKPNIHTMVQFYHFRVADVKNKLKKEWDKLLSDKCNLSREEFITNRNKLREIDEYIMAAKFKVEECLEKKEGKEIYEWAVKQLEIYTNECQC